MLVAGSSLGSMTTRNWSLIPADAQIIQVDIDGAEIGRNFECAVPMVGDVGAVIGQLAAAASRPAPAEWAAEVADIRAGWRAEVQESETSDAVPIRPERLFSMIGDEMAADADHGRRHRPHRAPGPHATSGCRVGSPSFARPARWAGACLPRWA